MLNKVILMGRFTRDPELRSTPQGISTCSFSIAVDRNFVRPGEERKADFINCVAWRQTAEFISKYFRKGSMVALEGSLQTRSWDDQDGKKRYATDVVSRVCIISHCTTRYINIFILAISSKTATATAMTTIARKYMACIFQVEQSPVVLIAA